MKIKQKFNQSILGLIDIYTVVNDLEVPSSLQHFLSATYTPRGVIERLKGDAGSSRSFDANYQYDFGQIFLHCGSVSSSAQ